MRWLLDTNAWIHYLKHPDSPIRPHLRVHPASEVLTCSIVLAELLHGAKKYAHPDRRTTVVVEALGPHESLPFDDGAAAHYATVRDHLERAGTLIGPNDLLIAAVCLNHDLTIVTSNVNEFRRVPGLRVEDWLASTA